MVFRVRASGFLKTGHNWARYTKRMAMKHPFATLRLRGRPERDVCQSTLWDCFGGRISTWPQIRRPKQSHNALWHPSRPSLPRNLKLANRPLPSSKNPHFQNEAKCTTFLVKMSYICMKTKNNFYIKGWALKLVLIQRLGGTRKWLITAIENQHIISENKITNLFYSVE